MLPGNLFVGYEKQRQKLLEGFRNFHSYAVIGGRRCGKTSLLMQIEKDIRAIGITGFSPIPGHFSLQELGSRITPDMLFERMYELIVDNLRDAPPWTRDREEISYRKFLRNLDKASPLLNRQFGPDWLVIYLIDEMDNAMSSLPDDQFFQNLRHFLMESPYKRHFRLVASGVKDMARLIRDGGSPLNNLRNVFLRNLDESEALELVEKGCSRLEADAIQRLFSVTGRHPFLLQVVLEKLWIESGHPDIGDMDAAVNEFLIEQRAFQKWIKAFDQTEKAVYTCLAGSPNVDMSIKNLAAKINASIMATRDAVTVLAYHGVIEVSTRKKIRVAGSLFMNWFMDDQDVPKPPGMEPEIKVFISYSRDNQDIAKRLYHDIKKSGVTPWMDAEDILPGQNWRVMIRRAIQESVCFLALLSNHSLSKRGYVHKELKIALNILDETPGTEVFIIPVRLDNCEPRDERLSDLHFVDLFTSYETGLSMILRSIESKGG